ncbi:hypothetical protein P0D91_03905 [Pseudomonas sp. CBSPBW29]|uniref:hypothetical protein n=1 Tax=Pseudomonas sp. CBS TaxID=2971912 RepID=UPI0021ACD36D|nr:hypothetical protein [Pseudomonas sp. CBS]WEL43490.1 hypothetical protein P0D91_03905 [Pseudomonas sp. CBSPBW29]WEL64557.1 hypothetical protein P0D93_31460 [Pseudomonas sp. CBSPGW29]WEL68029.1 hypothetical protein P0D94_17375 [Pseudomonas sp. CBSPCGW29]WEL75048.1 hypothetical protein P0D92_23415 [Pseudomonas sp. CBSPAW29]WEL80708.1 hypothetical protein P0D95_22375 [Pseudomonas sp. CBSPCAW29]WEL89227.1 hypothetical protein P0D90_04685 [Pseudomonas sp. CBSPCBW29]
MADLASQQPGTDGRAKNYHFHHQAPQADTCSPARYLNQTQTLFEVLEQAIAGLPFICVDFSIADMAIYTSLRLHKLLHVSLGV